MASLHNIRPAASAALDGPRLTSLPILVLAIHSQCNCRCEMCDIWKRKDGRELHAAELDRHRQSIRALGVKNVVLTGGEPLMNRELESICQFFRDLDLQITLLTTGLLLEKKADLVARFVDDIIVSIDGPADIHDRIRRVPNAFETIRKGIVAIRERKPGMPISCRTTVQKLNHAHLRATVAGARTLGMDRISFLAADVSSAAFNREDLWATDRQSEVALTSAELAELDEEIELLIEKCREDIAAGFIAEGGPKLRKIADHFRKHLEGLPPKSPMCNAPWVSAVVEVDGSVRPCFFHAPIGNAHEMPLEEAINTSAARAFRSGLNVETDATCQRCVCSLNYRQ